MNIKDIETPCFIIEEDKLDDMLQNLKTSFYSFWPNGIIGYSFKTNNLPSVIAYMKNQNILAEVVSSDEYLLAKYCGYDVTEIIFNGPAKRKKEFIEAVELGAIVNIETKRELQWLLSCDKNSLKNSNIGIRVNFCLEDYCPNESQCGSEDGRFGFSYETGELLDALEFLKKYEIPLKGIHLHCSSKTRSINIYKAICKIAVEIINAYKLELDYIDIGGGFFGGLPNKPTFYDYFKEMNEILKHYINFKKTKIIIEPGMAIIGACVKYVTSVIDVKSTKNNTFVVLDGSRIHIDPLMRKSTYDIEVEKLQCDNKKNKYEQILCGFTCMENDRFLKYSSMPLQEGDLVVFNKVGAYTIGLSAQFIEFHPIIYSEKSGKIVCVQRRKNVKDFIVE